MSFFKIKNELMHHIKCSYFIHHMYSYFLCIFVCFSTLSSCLNAISANVLVDFIIPLHQYCGNKSYTRIRDTTQLYLAKLICMYIIINKMCPFIMVLCGLWKSTGKYHLCGISWQNFVNEFLPKTLRALMFFAYIMTNVTHYKFECEN